MPKLNEYLTVGEAAELLGVSKDTLRRWDRDGKLAARRHPVTRYRLYLETDLASLLGSVTAKDNGVRSKLKPAGKLRTRGSRARS